MLKPCSEEVFNAAILQHTSCMIAANISIQIRLAASMLQTFICPYMVAFIRRPFCKRAAIIAASLQQTKYCTAMTSLILKY